MCFPRKNRNTGFTLAELLIVVAIIAVLIAITIPIFKNKLEIAREARDLYNIRNAYSELSNIVMLDEQLTNNKFEKLKDGYRTYIRCESTQRWWQTKGIEIRDNCAVIAGNITCGAPNANKPCIRLRYYESTGKFEFLAVEQVGPKAITYN